MIEYVTLTNPMLSQPRYDLWIVPEQDVFARRDRIARTRRGRRTPPLPGGARTHRDAVANRSWAGAPSRFAGLRVVYAIDGPLEIAAASRYRDRYRTSGGKSDAFDAMVLANVLRTDHPAHRQLPDDTPAVQALRVLTRAQQDAVWERAELCNRVRALLKAFFPAALAAFERGGKHQLHSAACRTILQIAPTPRCCGAAVDDTPLRGVAQGWTSPCIEAEAVLLKELLRAVAMRQLPAVEDAMGLQLRGLVRQLGAVAGILRELEPAIEAAFAAHPDAPIVASFPGLGVQLGAGMLAQIGDGKTRFADGRVLKAFADAAPVTRASGKSRFVQARRAKNDRIAAAGYG